MINRSQNISDYTEQDWAVAQSNARIVNGISLEDGVMINETVPMYLVSTLRWS